MTDKNYITNSYHVHVTEQINAFDKLKFESQFQELSPGGAISYVEVPNMQNNLEAVLSVMQSSMKISCTRNSTQRVTTAWSADMPERSRL